MAKRQNRLVRAVTDAMWKRDRLQMKAIDTLVAATLPSQPGTPRRRRRGQKRG